MMKEGVKIAIVGATGAVGKELLAILESRRFPVRELVLFASPRSEGKAISWMGRSHRCRKLAPGCFEGIQIAFFDASDAISKEWALQAAESGAWVVDNSSTFRMDEDTLLLVPEVNGDLLDARMKSKPLQSFSPRERILTGPNCVAVPLAVALKPIQVNWGIKRVVVSTYQSTSGAGAAAMEELARQTAGLLNGQNVPPKVFPHPIAFNCIPHIGGFKDDGSTSEEVKIIQECQKLLGMPQLRISATAVRVPTFSCHAESINVECERSFTLDEVRSVLKAQAGAILQDSPKENVYPLGMKGQGIVEGGTGNDAVYIGRVRKDSSIEHGLNLWVVSDNLRKGAALNAIQVGEQLLKYLQ